MDNVAREWVYHMYEIFFPRSYPCWGGEYPFPNPSTRRLWRLTHPLPRSLATGLDSLLFLNEDFIVFDVLVQVIVVGVARILSGGALSSTKKLHPLATPMVIV